MKPKTLLAHSMKSKYKNTTTLILILEGKLFLIKIQILSSLCVEPNCFQNIHINIVKTKMAKTIALLHRDKHILNQKSLCSLFSYGPLRHFLCGDENTYKSNTNPAHLWQ